MDINVINGGFDTVYQCLPEEMDQSAAVINLLQLFVASTYAQGQISSRFRSLIEPGQTYQPWFALVVEKGDKVQSSTCRL